MLRVCLAVGIEIRVATAATGSCHGCYCCAAVFRNSALREVSVFDCCVFVLEKKFSRQRWLLFVTFSPQTKVELVFSSERCSGASNLCTNLLMGLCASCPEEWYVSCLEATRSTLVPSCSFCTGFSRILCSGHPDRHFCIEFVLGRSAKRVCLVSLSAPVAFCSTAHLEEVGYCGCVPCFSNLW